MNPEGRIAGSLSAVRARIAGAALRAGRRPGDVTLIGISKTMPAEAVQEAVAAGLADLGENRVQEADAKIPAVRPGPTPLTWHLVGRLQQNKARRAVALFPWIHSIDSVPLAQRIDRIAGEIGARPSLLVEVSLAGEAAKGGIAPGELGLLLEAMGGLSHARLAGLMAIPPHSAQGQTAEGSRPWFRKLRELQDTWRLRGYDLPALSMGMTDDFEIAIEEGATHVRVGRALFGERPAAAEPAGTEGTARR
ncbi:MAG TPA: YggS family pyridoxal phosphate-dependent enzyme [Verrucomicrobiae bacterium]|nr:YggS family pyridoxal phosphate-dependent enzyme [Verrucomicrobiae bacterium]